MFSSYPLAYPINKWLISFVQGGSLYPTLFHPLLSITVVTPYK